MDEMLGKLTRWLRILGFNTIWAGELRKSSSEDVDNKILIMALKDDLVLITRDRDLAKKAKKYGVPVILIKDGDLVSRIKAVLSEVGIDIEKIDRMDQVRCPACNGMLVKADKRDIYDKIPPKSREIYDEFWMCENCGKIYWKGSHWRNIEKFIKLLKSCK